MIYIFTVFNMFFSSLLKKQNKICRKYGLPYYPTPLDSIAGISENVFEGIIPINGLRHPPEANTCGWYIWAGEDTEFTDDLFKPMCLKHLAETDKYILNYLALPPGARFLITKNYEDVWYDEFLLNQDE